jgi:hypothetical protein
MSWDIFVQDLPTTARTIADIPDTFMPAALGKRSEIVQRIRAFAPTARFADPAWGTFEAPTFSVEFNLGSDELVQSFALHVRGDDAAAAFVSDLLARLGYRALDPQSASGLFEPGQVAEASIRRWRKYLDEIIA